jgi:hypothetical protein
MALKRSRVVALIGPRQCGKTTLARQFLSPKSKNYFDLENSFSFARLDQPMVALEDLRGLISTKSSAAAHFILSSIGLHFDACGSDYFHQQIAGTDTVAP